MNLIVLFAAVVQAQTIGEPVGFDGSTYIVPTGTEVQTYGAGSSEPSTDNTGYDSSSSIASQTSELMTSTVESSSSSTHSSYEKQVTQTAGSTLEQPTPSGSTSSEDETNTADLVVVTNWETDYVTVPCSTTTEDSSQVSVIEYSSSTASIEIDTTSTFISSAEPSSPSAPPTNFGHSSATTVSSSSLDSYLSSFFVLTTTVATVTDQVDVTETAWVTVPCATISNESTTVSLHSEPLKSSPSTSIWPSINSSSASVPANCSKGYNKWICQANAAQSISVPTFISVLVMIHVGLALL